MWPSCWPHGNSAPSGTSQLSKTSGETGVWNENLCHVEKFDAVRMMMIRVNRRPGLMQSLTNTSSLFASQVKSHMMNQ